MQPLPPGRRPNHVIAAEARRKREEIREFMDQGGLDQGDVAAVMPLVAAMAQLATSKVHKPLGRLFRPHVIG